MDRYWLLTWSTYGTRLPGDPRGSVARVKTAIDERRAVQLEERATVLSNAARRHMRGPPVLLSRDQARHALADLGRSAAHRGWELLAASVMRNHVHVVVGVPADPDPADLLRVFKAYASRALNERFARPQSGTWWTASGSRRRLMDEPAVVQAMRYVLDQPGVLAMWGQDVEDRFA
ncbi:MAG: transposase [Dehalococcoidia bacterium]